MHEEESKGELLKQTLSGTSVSPIPSQSAQALAAGNQPEVPIQKDLMQEREFLWKVHAYTNEYIRFGDTKAGFCFGVASALIGALFISKSHELFTKVCPSQWTVWAYLSLSAFLLLGVSISATVSVIRPRLWKHVGKDFVFWGAISEFGTETDFSAKFAAQTASELNVSLAHHLYSLSKVCRRKYEYVNVAIGAAVLGGAIAIILLLFKS